MAGDNLFYEQMIAVLRPELERELIPSHVLLFLPYPRDVTKDILKAERQGRSSEAVGLLLDALLSRNHLDGWFTEFVDALHAAEFEKLARRLSLQDVEDDSVFKVLMHQCLPTLVKVRPMPIMVHLLQDNIINDKDVEEVRALERDGYHQAMFELLLRIQMRREKWFESLVRALKKENENEALRALDPLLHSGRNDDSITQVLIELSRGNSKDFESDPEKLKQLKEDDQPSPEAVAIQENSTHGEISETLEYQESRQPSLNVNAPNVDVNLMTLKEAEKPYIKTLPATETPASKPVAVVARFSPQDSSDSSGGSRISRETVAKEVLYDRAETPRKEPAACSRSSPSRAENRETHLKSLSIDQSFSGSAAATGCSERNDGDLDLRPDVCQPSIRENQLSRSDNGVNRLSEDFPSCSENNTMLPESCRSNLSRDDDRSNVMLIPDEERVLVPNEIFVSNLPLDVTVENLVDHFGMIGDIQLNSDGKPRVRLYRDKVTGMSKGEALITYSNEVLAMAAIDIFSGNDFEGNYITVEIAWRRVRRKQEFVQDPPSSVQGHQHSTRFEQPDDERTMVPPTVHEELNLRGYQQELAAQAKAGRNCIIVAPTGSGKTHVAMEIVRHHIERLNRRRDVAAKIVFFVPTVALVEQQRKQFERYLPGCNILGISGDKESKLPLSELVPINDIIVLTPQILENALKTEDFGSLSIFSLMIFDECHHTSKSHPYNMIMSHYIDEKLDHGGHHVRLAQVVGLTASVGVGKAKTMDQAVTSILKLCANMDSDEICTVKDNLEELDMHTNKPNEGTKELQGRREDPFFDTITAIMTKVEARMKNSKFAEQALVENSEFGQQLQAPFERGGDRYTQWISRISKVVDAIIMQDTRRFYVSCLRDLQIYNIALLINADCRTKDALDYIVKEFNPAKVTDLYIYHDETDRWLKTLFDERRTFLEEVSRNPKYENPKLNKLKEIICQEFEKAPDSRGIIFCKTREMTVALVNWMKETPELDRFKPHNLVGSNAPANRAGMTQVKQEDVLEYFKQGNHQLIVATSVAEEGLDVRKCNIVIRYEHVTNQIARVQSRGRARADNAQYLVVAEKGRGAAEKEECNKIREKMMQKAIDIINDLPRQEKHTRINRFQKEAQVEREMAKKGKRISEIMKASQQTNGRYILRCRKCDSFTAFSTDIRKIEASHHVILDPDYENRIKIRPHPGPKTFQNFELSGKIYCRRCHSDWGIKGIYKNVSFPVVKVCSLIVIDEETNERKVYKRWKNVPFQVPTLSPPDLQTMMDHQITQDTGLDEDDSECGDIDDEDDDESLYT